VVRRGRAAWEVGEYQQVEGDPFRASVWVEEREVLLDGEVEWRR
jgi:hypothetical protein